MFCVCFVLVLGWWAKAGWAEGAVPSREKAPPCKGSVTCAYMVNPNRLGPAGPSWPSRAGRDMNRPCVCVCQGDIYKKAYSGHYCVGCEAYLGDDEMEQAQWRGGCKVGSQRESKGGVALVRRRTQSQGEATVTVTAMPYPSQKPEPANINSCGGLRAKGNRQCNSS